MFENPGKSAIDAFLRRIRSVAIIGLSATPGRPSYTVAKALQKFGYRIVPVNPKAQEILGVPAWPDLESAIMGAGPVDVVEVFRRSEHVAAIVDDCIRLEVAALWLQEGVIDETAAQKARAAGIFTVMNRCMFRDRSTLE
ncbi:MAG: CoA-binding protein [Pseudomonadota bacterium]